MEENQKHACQTVRDPELCKWMETKGADLRELIVEVKLPLKKVTLFPGKHGRPDVKDINTDTLKLRHEILTELASFVYEISGEQPNILKAAGALATKATREQTRLLSKHRLVKAIRPNRHLKRPLQCHDTVSS